MLLIIQLKKEKKIPHIPQINRYAWENQIKNTLKNKWPILLKIFNKKDIYSFNEFEKIFYKNFKKNLWKNDVHDILYALESKKFITLIIEHGFIKKIIPNKNLKNKKLL